MSESKSNEAFIQNARQRALLSDAEANRLLRLCLDTGQPAAEIVREQLLLTPDDISLIEDSLETENLSEEIRQALADPSRCIGRYAKVEELGRGGMGVVYRCYDPQLHRSVAIKMILEAGEDDDEGLARFKREARAAAKLQHPGIVALHEVGEHQGSPYLVMDFVEGRSFDALLKREKPTARRKVEIVRDVAVALHHAHEAGIIHRDVKPQNVMVDPQGKPHVMDFGLARDSSALQQLTKTGQIMGTPVYMAPEQVDGAEMGPWTDVYALGVMLYRALTRKLPFTAGNPTVLFKQIIMDEPKGLRSLDSTISLDLETIALKCLEKEPDRRYPSAAAVAEELQRFLDGQAILARPLSRSERALRWTRRNRALSAALAVVVMVVVAALVGGVYMARNAERDAGRREERARLQAEKKAEKDKDAALDAAARQKEAKDLETLRREVTAVLDRVGSGERLVDPNDRRIERSKLLKHQDPETVRLLTAELDVLGKLLADSHDLSQGQKLFLHFLCHTLADLSLQEGAVASIGRYLRTEVALPAKHRDQLRAVPAGQALCLLGGEEADRLLHAARDGLGLNGSFWYQVQPLYKRIGVKPELEAETLEAYNLRGLARFNKEDLDGAIADFTRAIELDPNSAMALNLRGLARFANGEIDEAIADYTRALEIDPNDATVWNNRGVARKAQGVFDGAIADFTRALELDSQFVDAWINRGSALNAQGDHDEAIADYSHALEIDPTQALAWYNRGNARTMRRDSEGAIADYTRALEIDPRFIKAWVNRGFERAKAGQLDEAIADYTRALDINPRFIKAVLNRADAMNAQGDRAGATADWQRFLELAPNDRLAPAVRAAIQKLRAQQRTKDGADK